MQTRIWIQKFDPQILRRLSRYGLLVLWAAITFSSALLEISFALACFFWLTEKARTRNFMFLSPSLWAALGIYLALQALALVTSEYPALSWRGILKVLEQTLIFLMVADVFREPQAMRRFQFLFLAVSVLMAANGFYQYAFGKDLIRGFQALHASAGWRVSGSFKTYGILAAYLILIFPVIGVYAQSVKSRKAALGLWALLAAGLVLLFLTRSRGAMLAAALGTLAALFLTRRFIVLGILAVLLATGIFFLPRAMVIHLDADNKEQSLVERYYLWDRAVHVIRAKPFTGTGPNTYAKAHVKYDKTQNWRVRNYYAHNGYLQMAAETGLLGLIGFLYFVACWFARLWPGWKNWRDPEGRVCAGSMMGVMNFLIMAMIDTILHNAVPAAAFWYVLGLGAASLQGEVPPASGGLLNQRSA